MPTNNSIQTLPLSLSLVPSGLTPVSVFPPFETPRTLPVIGVIFTEAPNFDYDYQYDDSDALAAQQTTQAVADALAGQVTQAPADAQKAVADALAGQVTQAPADAQKAADALANPAHATPVPPRSAPMIPVTPPPAPTQQPPQPPTAQPTKSFQSPLLYGFRVTISSEDIECSQLGPDCEYDYNYGQQATQSAANAQVAADAPSAVADGQLAANPLSANIQAAVDYGQQVSDSRVRENRCVQIVQGRNFEYSRALEFIENEFYQDYMEFGDIRKKRDLTAKNPSEFETKYARVLGSDKRPRNKRQTGQKVSSPEEFISLCYFPSSIYNWSIGYILEHGF